MGHPGASWAQLSSIWPEMQEWPAEIREQIETDAQYAGYLDRQSADIAAFRRDESLKLPQDFDYMQIEGMSNEVRQKAGRYAPHHFGPGCATRWYDPSRADPALALCA